MGGEGSGRKPDVVKMMNEQQIQRQAPIADELFIPNYSGLQAVRKTDPAISASGHIIQDEGSNLTARTYLNFSGSNVLAFDDGTATVVSITGGSGGDNFWTSGSTALFPVDGTKGISGSQIWVGPNTVLTSYTETDPIFLSLSGGIAVGGDVTGTTSSIQIDHVNIASIGTNTHAQIDTHIADTSDPHGTTLTQTNITSSGMFSGSRIWAGSVLSGSEIFSYNTISGSAMMVTGDHTTSGSANLVGIITHTSATPPTASNFPQGTIYIRYTA